MTGTSIAKTRQEINHHTVLTRDALEIFAIDLRHAAATFVLRSF